MKKILVVGATSAIAQAAMRIWASEGASFYLVARDSEKLSQVAEDLRVKGAKSVSKFVMDINDTSQHVHMLEAGFSSLKEIEIFFLASGTLPVQSECEENSTYAMREFATNSTSQIHLLIEAAKYFKAQRYGILAVISSVAGDRGRKSNYLYGSAKSAVSTFCEGLRGNLFSHGVDVLLIKPGMVSTPMTHGLPMPTLLTSTADRVGEDIVMAIRRRKSTLYTPGYWRLIMLVIKHIPASVMKRLKF